MFVFLSDTHSTEPPELAGSLGDAIDDASLVAHAGDFTTGETLDAIESRSERLVAVAGNSDSPAVTERLPAQQVFEQFGGRFLLVHGHRHDRTSLSLLARQENADVVVVGHTHSAGLDHVGETLVVNPGSHADPRGGQPTYGVGRQVGDGFELQIRTVAGRKRDAVEMTGDNARRSG